MHVFIITQYFPPELGASASRWGDYVEIISEHSKVTVLCESPHYPKKEYFPGYKNSWLNIEKKNPNLTIIRSKAFASNRKSFLKKITHYLVFMLSAIINSRKVKNYDLLIVSSPPLFNGLIGLFIKIFFKNPFWLDIRDLWPESVFELGQIKKGLLYKMGKKLEVTIYGAAEGFIFPVPHFRKYLNTFPYKISNKPKLELLNGVSNSFLKDLNKTKVSKDKSFTVLYSGNMGLAQDLSIIIKAAEILKDYEIYFRFIGEGVCRAEIEQLAKPYASKIFFSNSIKRVELIKYIKKASVCLVPLKDKKIFDSALPSKMFEYMASERPVIVSVRGEAKSIVDNSQSGIAIEPENAAMLSKAILTYFNDPVKCKIDGLNGYNFVIKKLLKEKLMSNVLNKIIDE